MIRFSTVIVLLFLSTVALAKKPFTATSVTGVSFVTANGSYNAGDNIDINVTFGLPVTVTGTPQLELNVNGGGVFANYLSGSTSTTLVFRYTVAGGHTSADFDYLATNSLTLNGGTIVNGVDPATLTLPAVGTLPNGIIVDTTSPTVSAVSSSTSDGSYKAGQVVAVTVQFSEVVNVTGTPQITLETGATDRTVNYVSGTGTNTLTFNYTVQAGDVSSDLDYTGTGALALNGGTITDVAGNNATLTLASPGAAGSLGNAKAIIIDTTAPTVTSVSSSTANGSYKAGQSIAITIQFSENVVVTGTPQLTLETGGTDQVVDYSSGTGTNTLTFNYTVQAGNVSSDLDYTTTTALALNGGTIGDVATNAATLTLATPGAANSLGANKDLVIDTQAPTVSNVSSSATNGTFIAGNSIAITVLFSEAVNVTGTPQLTLETGATDRVVNYASGTGTNTLTFNYTVQAGDVSSDLDYVNTTSLALNSGTILDAATNAATLTLATPGAAGSLGANKALVVDGVVPTVSNVTSSTANGTYKAGQAIAVNVVFSELVDVTGTPQLTLETGTTDRVVNYASGTGTTTLTFTYTVQAGDISADLDYTATNSLALNSGTIKDASGNDATLTLASPGAAGSLGANKDIVVDAVAPTVSNVTSSLADGSYKTGQVVPVTIQFSEIVNVTGTPQITLETGATDRVVNYTSGTGTNTLTFNYTVQAGDVSSDLDYTGTSSLALNGGTILDAATNAATLTLATPGAAGSLGANKALVIDTQVPTVSGVSSSAANGNYNAGDVIAVTVQFSEVVIVTGTPQITLETGGTDEVVNYSSGSGTNTLTFNYTVQSGNTSSDLDYTGTTALALNGGTIQDAATNNATLTLASPGAVGSLGNSKAIVIDTQAPTVSNVTSSTSNGSYNGGDAIVVTVQFSETVTVTGTPQLTLETGTTDQVIDYVSGSGTNTLTFNYTVQAGDVSSDLDYVGTNSLALNGGSIQDGAGNNATLTLASPGAAGSLGANKALVIDTQAPTIVSIVRQSPASALTNATTVTFRITFSENVVNTDQADFVLNPGNTVTGTISGFSTVTPTTVFDVTVNTLVGTAATDVLNLDIAGGQNIADGAGNAFAGAITLEQEYNVDTTKPILSPDEMTLNPNGGAAETITFTVSETLSLGEGAAVTGFTSSTGSVASATYTGSGATNTITLVNGGADGTWTTGTTISYSAGNVADLAGNTLANITTHAVTQNIVNLSAGAIAFTSFKSDDPNNFSIVLLRDISAGTAIKFTDNGWTNANTLRTNEQTFTWTADVDYFAGSEITFTGTASGGSDGTISASHGTILPVGVGSELKQSTSGDQIIAYQGPSTSPTFIAAIHYNGASWDANATNDQTSALPTGLTNGTNAIAVGNIENGVYNRSTLSGTASAVRTALNTSTNWTINDNPGSLTFPTANLTAFTLPPDVTGAFTPAAGSTVPATLPNLSISYTGANLSAGTSTGADIVLKRHSDGAVIPGGTWNVGTAAVTFTGTTVNVNTSALALTHNEVYRLEVAKRVFVNTDFNGNTAIGGGTWTFTADAVAPTVTSVVRKTPATSPYNGNSVVFTVTFSESVNGLTSADFSANVAGFTGTTGAINVSAGSGTTVDVTINSIVGNGTLGLNVLTASSILDGPGNAMTTGTPSGTVETYVIDQTLPTVTNIVRKTPSTSNTNASTVTYTVTFSEDIDHTTFTDADLTKNYTNLTTGTATFVETSPGVFDVTLPTVVAGSPNGTLQIQIAAAATISDLAGNDYNSNFVGPSYLVDQVAPTVASINRVTGTPTTFTTLDYTVTFSESVSNIDINDFELTKTTTADGVIASVSSSSGSVITVTINSITGDGDLRLDLKTQANGASVLDAGGNAVINGFTSGQAYTVDNNPPVVVSVDISGPTEPWSNANGTSATSLTWLVTFNENVSGVDLTDFQLNAPGGLNYTYDLPAVLSGSGNTRTITLNNVKLVASDSDAKLYWDVKDDNTITDVVGNFLGGPLLGDGALSAVIAYPGSSLPGFNDYYTVLYPEPANTPNTYAVSGQTPYSFSLNWVGPVEPLITLNDVYYFVQLKDPSVGSFSNLDDGTYPQDYDISDGAIGFVIQSTTPRPFDIQTYLLNFLGQSVSLKSGTTYDVRITPLAFSGTVNSLIQLDYAPGHALVGTGTTTTAQATNMFVTAAPTTIGSIQNASGTGANVMQFEIFDDGSTPATWALDNAPFKFSKIVINPGAGNSPALNNWTDIIAGAELSDGTTTIPGDVASGTITFPAASYGTSFPSTTSGDFGYIPDASATSSSKNYTLKIWLHSSLNSTLASLVDGLRLAFSVSPTTSFTFDNSSNQQLTSQFSLAQPVLQSGQNPIDVVATKLVFNTPGPSPINTNPQATIGVATPFSSSNQQQPIVYALDANNNLDQGFTQTGTIDTPGPDPNLSPSITSQNFTSGVLNLSALKLNAAGTNGKIRVQAPGILLANSAISSNVTTVITNLTTISEATAPASELASLTSVTNADPGAGTVNFDFTVTDDASASTTDYANNDGLPTLIQTITISQGSNNGDNTVGGDDLTFDDWTKSIAGAVLTDGTTTTTLANLTISGSSLVFNVTGYSMQTIADGTAKTYRLRIWLRNPVDATLRDILDNKDFVFTVDEGGILPFATLNSTSGLAASSASTGDNRNVVTVTATRLDFTTQWAAGANQSYDAPLAPSPVVKARDANGNLDINYAATPTVGTGAPVTYPLANTTVTNTGGIITFDPNLLVTSAGNGPAGGITTLVVSQGLLTPATSNNFTLNYSGSSDIIKPAFAYPTDILYANNQEAADLTFANSIELEQFTLRDGAGSNDADGSPTVLNSITFNVGNWQNLRRLALYDAATEIADQDVATTINTATGDITFSGITFTAADNGTKVLSLRASFNATVDDNEVITFRVAVVAAKTTSSSQFGNTTPLGVQSNPTSNENAIEVVATRLDIISPVAATPVSINTNFTPLIAARDANSNVDLDFEGAGSSVTEFTNSAGVTMTNGPVINTTQFVDGILNFATAFPNFQFTSGNNNANVTLTIKAGTGTNCGVDAICTNITPTLTLKTSTLTAGALAEPAIVSSLLAANSPVFDFRVNDDDLVVVGTDALPTLISTIKITQQTGNTVANWSQLINSAILSDGVNSISGTVNTSDITFSGMPITSGSLGYIADNAFKTYTLYITLNTSLVNSLRTTVDNESLAFEVLATPTNVVTAAAGTSSKFSVSESEASGLETIQVIATRLNFTTQPPATASVDADLSVVPVVEAVDFNNNTDEDYNSTLTITNAGSLVQSNAPTSISSGVTIFPSNFQYRQAGNGTLNAASGVLTAAVSSNVTVSFSSNSDIVRDGSFTYPTNIPYANHQATDIVQDANSIDLERLILRDGGGSNDADGASTRLQAIDIQITSVNAIRRLALYDGVTELAEVTPSATGVASFTGLSLTATDGTTRAFTLRASFNSTVVDNDVVTFKVIGVASSVGIGFGSSFAAPDGGGAVSSVTGDGNRIEVTATQLDYTTPSAPTTASINTNFAPVIVEARDVNANLDTDFTGTITASGTTGGLTTTNNPTGSFGAVIAGKFTYPANFQYLTDGSPGSTLDKGTLTMTAGGISGTSVGITVLSSFDSKLEIDPITANVDASIDYAYYHDNISSSNGKIISTLTLWDGDADGDIDGANTTLDDLTLSITNPSNIYQIALFDKNNNIIGGAKTLSFSSNVSSANVVFSGVNIIATDQQNSTPGKETFTVRATFYASVDSVQDNDLIQLQIKGATQSGGSKFINALGSPTYDAAYIGGVLNGSVSPAQHIAVTATKFDFIVQPGTGGFAGIDEPITAPIIHAHDQNNLLDEDFNEIVTLSTHSPNSAGLSITNPTFAAGVLDLTGLQYTSPGDGTILVDYGGGAITSEETGTELGLPNGSVPSTHVDVIHVEAVEIIEGTNGVYGLDNIQGGSINTTIFGFTFNVVNDYKTASEPSLNGFTISFDSPFKKSGAYSFKNFRIFEADNGQKDSQSKNITTLSGSVTEGSSGAFGLDLDILTITFTAPRPLYGTSPKSYFLVADVDLGANKSTTPITPMLVDLGYGDASNGGIVTTKGSAKSKGNNPLEGEKVVGLTFNFASSKPPKLVSSVPSNAKLNVSPDLSQIDLYFDVDVVTFDAKAELYDYKTDRLIATLPALNGVYNGDIDNLSPQVVTPLSFDIPNGVVLKPDSLYYIKIAQGSYDPATNTGTGIADENQNLYGGISYNGTLYFKVSRPVPPKMLSTNTGNYFLSNSAGIFNAAFDQKGKGYYLVLDHNLAVATPTIANILDYNTYPQSSAHVAHGSFNITQVSPNLQYVPFAGTMTGSQYDVWIFAENDAEPTPIATTAPYGGTSPHNPGDPGPTLQMLMPAVITHSNFPIIQVCPDSEVIVTDPIILGEVNPNDFNDGGIQNFNVLLPTGVAFDITYPPTVVAAGGDFVGSITHSFINNTILNISFTNTGSASLDNIIISNFKLKVSASVENASITRFAGTGLAPFDDGDVLATISANPLNSQKFTNSFTTSNDFSGVGLSGDAAINVIPDNFNEATGKVRLIPDIEPSNDYGPNSFSGPGVTDDILNLTGVVKNTGFDIVMTHTDLNGCVTQTTAQYLVYDHTDAIPLIGTEECITNVNFPNGDSPSLITPASPILTYGAKAGYLLTGLYANIPSKATSTSQKIFGPDWQALVNQVPVPIDTVVVGSIASVNYHWDYAPLLNAVNESDGAITMEPYNNFADTTLNDQPFWKGGSLGLVEFTGKYRSTADKSVEVPFRQEVEIFVPPIPVVEIRNKYQLGTEVICQNDGSFVINGFPQSDGATSTGFFTLRDSVTNNVIDLSLTPGGFKDNSNGTATFTPSILTNAFTTIKVEYTYKENNSPCSGTGYSYLRIAPNPTALMQYQSAITPNSPTASAYCENIPITFDASGSIVQGGTINDIKSFEWTFIDQYSSNQGATGLMADHLYTVTGPYQATLKVTSKDNCASPIAEKTINVGKIPEPDFIFDGVSTADDINFTSTAKVNSAPAVSDGIGKLDWDFDNTSSTSVTANFSAPVSTKYIAEGKYSITLTVTSILGCAEDVSKEIIILPQATPDDATAYERDFESNGAGWQTSATVGSASGSSWQSGTPTGKATLPLTAKNGTKVWVTNLTGPHNSLERSALYTPSFDLTKLDRPMISFDHFTQVAAGEGASIEYSIDNKNVADPTKQWIVLGNVGSGVAWYDAPGLSAQPGFENNEGLGWTGESTAWQESKHVLDDVLDQPRVVFRFAFATLTEAPTKDGFAIDNIRIGNRTRTVLMENFKNLGNANSDGSGVIEKIESDNLRTFKNSAIGTKLVKMNYHVGFPQRDPFNLDNPQDPSSRALYYSIRTTPLVRMDGSGENGRFSVWGENWYNTQTLKLANAKIQITPTINTQEGSVEVSVTIESIRQRLEKDSTILQVAIVEKSVNANSLPASMKGLIQTGETDFEYVVKKMLPSATGTRLTTTLTDKQTATYSGFSWTPERTRLYSTDNLAVVAFLQNEKTREVYQAEIVDLGADPDEVTGLEPGLTIEDVTLFPNPADEEVTIVLPRHAVATVEVQMIDQSGRTLIKTSIAKGEREKKLNVRDLPGSIYLIRLEENGQVSYKRAMVVHRN